MANTQLTQTGAQVQADLNKIEGLPTPTVADSGKVVGVNSSGQYVLVNAGGGGGDTPPTTPTDAVIFYSKYPFSLRVYDNTKHWDGTLYYSYDDSIWDTWSGTTTLNGDLSNGYYKLYIRGVGNTKITGSSNNYRWVFIGEGIRCCGNLNKLLSYNTTPTLADYTFAYLFYRCGNVSFDVTLPATTLARYCYSYMFSGCISLMTAPELPATTLVSDCYLYMFNGCTSLTTPAKMAGGTTQATPDETCCQQMYYDCVSLNIYTSASGHTAFYKALTYSTSGGSGFYSTFRMFYNCYIDGTKSTTNYLPAGTQYYY